MKSIEPILSMFRDAARQLRLVALRLQRDSLDVLSPHMNPLVIRIRDLERGER